MKDERKNNGKGLQNRAASAYINVIGSQKPGSNYE
jgi:hypothetical protein